MLDLLVLTNIPNVDASIKLFSRSVKYKFRIIRSYVQCNMFMHLYMIGSAFCMHHDRTHGRCSTKLGTVAVRPAGFS